MAERDIPDIDLDNPDFITAVDMVNNTNRSIFLTGKAGSGKSTLLKYICQTTRKKFIVLAPTGIAAVNVGGMTMHSFFKMPLKPLLPDDPDFSRHRMQSTLKYPKDKVKIIKQLDLIIIDEISMVRADMIDFMDRVLRHFTGNYREPFGGKQLLLVGDIFQLEPVIKTDFREILRRYYPNFFFFNATAFAQIKLVSIELRKTYRQKDADFIGLLDRVRENCASAADLECINSRYNRDGGDAPGGSDFVMTLATRRDTVDYINEQRLNELATTEHTFGGEIDGQFPEPSLPTSLNLTLKEGAQVVFIRNDKERRWYNGTIARIASITNEDGVKVQLENGEQYLLDREQWENVQYEYDDKEKRIKETVLGTFTQYPIKLAWAMTIHKSQGLTFNRVVIDMDRGAFSCGQTYVALSRSTSLEGISLMHPITPRDIFVNPAVVDFSRHFNDMALIGEAKRDFKARAALDAARRAFDKRDIKSAIENFADAVDLLGRFGDAAMRRLVRLKLAKLLCPLERKIAQQQAEIDRQQQLLRSLAQEYVFMGRESLSLLADGGDDAIAIDSAIANFDKAVAIDPGCVEALVEKGNLLMKLGKKREAENIYKEVLKIEKGNSGANYGMALLLLGRGITASALKHLKTALKATPTDPRIHLKLAEVYDSLGFEELARKHRAMAKKSRK